MTVESIPEREQLAEEIEQFLVERDQAYYPVDVVSEFEKRGRDESVILSAIWRLIDEHRIRLDNRLKVVALAPSH
ncbi:MAG TPA: hypothetical protein VM450_07425 [Thermomicrobiales bacterium]|jgi:hypothetical protein|nr:hypothetical protein [Thermomicrobiales bacterium]